MDLTCSELIDWLEHYLSINMDKYIYQGDKYIRRTLSIIEFTQSTIFGIRVEVIEKSELRRALLPIKYHYLLLTTMTSDESDDEPLSSLAEAKRANPKLYVVQKKKKTKKILSKKLIIPTLKPQLTITLKSVPKPLVQTVVKRPGDVWLYLKDLNGSGPYSCLLCPDWFTNRPKIIIHYVLNHKKDFCGICRYFVPDRDAWIDHIKFHTPWPCSQCVETFPTEELSRNHLRNVHNLVHCRLCHFRLSTSENYDSHLYQKHNVTNVACIYGDLWDTSVYNKFLCLLCMKPDNISTTLVSHFMGYHHLTLKCLANLVSGKDPPFTVKGVDVSLQFIETELKGQTKWGYVDIDNPVINAPDNNFADYVLGSQQNQATVEVKQEVLSDSEEGKLDGETNAINAAAKSDNEDVNQNDRVNDERIDYAGIEDFDITLTEIILLEECFYDYIDQTLNNLNNEVIPDHSFINYQMLQTNFAEVCSLCPARFEDGPSFAIHMNKAHSVKLLSSFSCRVCSTNFDSPNELVNHINEELGDFEDLWICQFCDKEFDNREKTRNHLTEHWNDLELGNCFSPHLGFKCKFCPMLFWNEPDRELHQLDLHFPVFKDQFYRCIECEQTFGDKKHNQISTPYLLKCCICCNVLTNMDDMRKHFSEHHPEARKLFCSLETCVYKPLSSRKSFKIHLKKKDSYREHIQIHEGPRHACSYCPMRFVQRSNMLRHERRHTGERPYQTHSRDTSFACIYCGQTFVQKSKLTYHIRKHTGENLETCTICSKLFTSACSLREHMKTHVAKEENVKCPLCDKKYPDERYMLRHLRVSHTNTQYTCPICKKVISSTSGLRHHVMTHSDTGMFQRHNLTHEGIKLKDYYKRLDPRECNLNLDEETMNSIFGPPKRQATEVLVGDFVTFTKSLKFAENLQTEDTDDDVEEEEGSDAETNEQAIEEPEQNEYELEPTDFVSIKIETVEEENFESQ
ncbi:unnamed protein product [Leptidea sinapis]|uniref:C2H2-type domain-containing protein n=1 Tax=Leptidea sinapis TaxID=189913 RepID=A0A5E4PZJ5_9NEOP|nr:unnamed protein product [Leptidea sinapis]